MTRDAVLARIRNALGVKGADSRSAPEPLPPWVPPVDPVADPIARFIEAAEAVQAEVHRGDPMAPATIRPLLEGIEAIHPGPGVHTEPRGVPAVDEAAAAQAPATVAGVAWGRWGVAESGSVVVETDGAHLPSLLTETSILLLPSDRILGRLEDLPPPEPDVRGRILVTGPSRTADIEKKIVLGAHGPRRLVVVLSPPMGRDAVP